MYFTVKKLNSMEFRLRADKVAAVLKVIENDLENGAKLNSIYVRDICHTVLSGIKSLPRYDFFNKELKKLLFSHVSDTETIFIINNIRHLILSEIGRNPAEWDLSTPLDKKKISNRKIFDINVYLDNIRSPFNVGSIFRTAESFCFNSILLSDLTPSPDHKRAKRSSMGTSDIVEWKRASEHELPFPVFALEIGGVDIEDFEFPEKGTVIIGSEELGVSPESMKLAKNSKGVVTIPLNGYKSSINVGVAFAILAYNWSKSINAVK